MSELRRRPGDALAPLLTLLAMGVVLLSWWPIVLVGHRHGERLPLNPAALMIALVRHRAAWPGSIVLVSYALELVLLVAAW